MPWDPDAHGRANRRDHLNRPAPAGHESRAFRVQAPAELLDAFQRLTPEARGRLITSAMTARVAQTDGDA